MRIETLQKRAEFQRVRGGGRCSHASFVLEGKLRRPDQAFATPRFGFTVTKKVGNAVVRNRIRRRIKAALAELIGVCADTRFDYVVVARLPAFDQPYDDLKASLQSAFDRVHGKAAKVHSAKIRPPSNAAVTKE